MNFEKIPRLRIGDACQAGDGAHASIKRIEAGVPYLMARNIKDGKLDLAKISYISEADFEKHFKVTSRSVSRVRENDVVFGIIGSIGDAYIVKKHDRFGLSSSVAILRPDTSQLNPKYLYYWVLGEPFQTALYNIKGGVAQGYVSLEMIKSLPLSVPNLSVQGRIASILSAYDNLIENNTRRIEILEEMARRLYEEWFVHFRFPGHEEVSFKESELGEIPEGWEYASLESFGMILTGKTPSKKKPELFGSEVPFIKLPDMHGQIFITETNEALSREGEETQRKKTVPANSICVSCIGTGGIVAITSEPSQTNQQINTVVPARSDLREFLYFSALSLRDDINNYGATGATMTNLSRGKFASLKVIAPCEEMVSSYSKLTAPMFDRILNLQRANRNLRAQRDLLLPKLVSGEIDVSNMPNDKEVEAA